MNKEKICYTLAEIAKIILMGFIFTTIGAQFAIREQNNRLKKQYELMPNKICYSLQEIEFLIYNK